MNLFYKKLRDKIYPHKSEVDVEDIWAGVLAELPEQKKRRRGFIWWWMAVGVVVIMSGVFSVLYFQGNKNSDLKLAPKSQKESIAKIENQQKAVKEEIVNKETIKKTSDQKINTEDAINNIAIKSTQINKAVLTPTISSEILVKSKSIVNKKLSGISEPSTSQASFTTSENFDQSFILNKQTNKTNLQPISPKQNNQSINQVDLLAGFSSIHRKVFFAKNTLSLPDLQIDFPPADYLNNQHYNPFSISLQTGLHRLVKEENNTSQLLNLSERPLDAIQLGLNVRYQTKQGWYAGVGLDYVRMQEKFNWQKQRITRDTMDNQLVEVELNQSGDTTNLRFDQKEITQVSNYRVQHFNTIQLYSVPVSLGYHWKINRLAFELETGVNINLLQTASGRILDENQNIVDFSEQTILRKRVDLSWQTAFRVAYALDPNWSIHLAPTFRYQFGENTRAAQSPGRTYHLLGVQTGVRYHF